MLAAQLLTSNLVFKGVVGGFIIALVAMGIVLIYRSSRVINFAVGNLGIPATALFAIMAGKHGWPYWPALIAALVVGTLSGTVVELTVIRRLFHAPRVIVLVATIGVAQLAQAVTLALPDYRTGSLQTQFPLPFEGEWQPGFGIDVNAAQLLILIVVPLVTLGLWWLLNHTRFGDQVRAAASNADLARMTGISPKLVSTAVWSIAGFLSAMAVLLTATDRGSTELVSIGPETLLRGLAAALIGGMVSFPRAALGAVLIGVGERVLSFHYPSETGLVQFLLLVLVVVLVARVSRREQAGGESFQFAPRTHAVPERMRSIWWVRRLPQLLGLGVLVVAVVAPLTSDLSARHQVWAVIVGFAICAISVVVLTGWGGQLSLGQMAFGGIAALTAATLARGLSVDIGWRGLRVARRNAPARGVPVDGADRRRRRLPRRGAPRHRRAPGTGAAPRGEHARVRHRGPGLPVAAPVLHRRPVDRADPTGPSRALRPDPQEPCLLLPLAPGARRRAPRRRASPTIGCRTDDRRRA